MAIGYLATMGNSRRPKAYSYVRISTDGQIKGDGQRRQIALSKAFAKEHDLDLDEEFTLHDIGVSAFRGKHIRSGNLGRFINAIEEKKIEPGSYLLIESLDRLSRQKIYDAQRLFTEIITAGIHIATLSDKRIYNAKNVKLEDVLLSLLSLHRAHEESQMKSFRLSQTWAEKRTLASQEKLTAWCPAWLELDDSKATFKVIKTRAEVVRRIFEECAAGLGIYSIARRLNEDKVPCFGRTSMDGKKLRMSNGWHTSYVSKILSNPATYGEFQPHKRNEEGRRVPDGHPIKHYFPAVLDEDLFFRAKASRSSRDVRQNKTGRGRKGAEVRNLFAGVAKCAYCRSTMYFESKGTGPKGGSFLVCDGMRRGLLGCGNPRWRYDEFETSFLHFVTQLNLQEITLSSDVLERQGQLSRDIDALEGRRNDLMEKLGRISEAIESATESRQILVSRLDERSKELEELEVKIRSKREEYASLTGDVRNFYESKSHIVSLLQRFRNSSGADEDVFKVRAQIAHRIRALVDNILVAGVGTLPVIVGEAIRQMEATRSAVKRRRIEALLSDPNTQRRYFSVSFKDGFTLVISPGGNPTELDISIAGRADQMVRKGTDGDETLTPMIGSDEFGAWVEKAIREVADGSTHVHTVLVKSGKLAGPQQSG